MRSLHVVLRRLVLSALVALPAVALAQVKPGLKVIPTKPKPFLIMGDTNPNVFISPGTGYTQTSVSPQLPVTLEFGDRCELGTTASSAHLVVTLNSQNVTSLFTYTGGGGGPQCTGATAQATGTITLRGGIDTLMASIENQNFEPGADTVIYTYTPGKRGLRVTVAAGGVNAPPSTTGTIGFAVYNLGNVTDTIKTSVSCSGSGLTTSCSLSQTTFTTVPPGDSVTGTATYTTTSTIGALGRLKVAAWSQSQTTLTDTGYVDVTVRARSGPGVVLAGVAPGVTRARNKCVTISLRPGIAYQCGDLQVSHELPPTRTFGKVRTPYLVYHTNIANGLTNIGALVTLDSTKGTPDTVTVTVTDSTGTTQGTGKWTTGLSAFAHGVTQRVTVVTNTGGVFYGTHWPYTVTVTAKYNSLGLVQQFTATNALISQAGTLAGGNEGEWGGPAGWRLAGEEWLILAGNGVGGIRTPWTSSPPISWFNAEGDTRLYVPLAGDSLVWKAQGVDRPDSIRFTSIGYVRYAPHGAKVVFEGHGTWIETIDRLGDTTYFGAGSAAPLEYVLTLPAPVPFASRPTYQFFRNSNGTELDSVVAPAVSGQARTVYFHFGDLHQNDTIIDPDTSIETFAYKVTTGNHTAQDMLTQYTDKRGTNVRFVYDTGAKLASVVVDTGAFPHLSQTTTFAAGESRGILAPVLPDSAYTLVTGPRKNAGGDSADISRFWIDQLGEPTRIRDAHGGETELIRGDTLYPALVTYARYPNGRVVTAGYDGRGNPISSTDSSHVVSGVAATTQYTFDTRWDFVTQVLTPTGVQNNFQYDATDGNQLWAQQGSDSSTRVRFTYYPASNSARNLVATELEPAEAPKADSIYYDATLGNANATVTPKGFRKTFLTDAVGRIIRSSSPIDSLNIDGGSDPNPRFRVDSTGYNQMSRIVLQKSYGPKDSSFFNHYAPGSAQNTPVVVAAETSFVTTIYEPHKDGHPFMILRQASPDINSIGTISDSMTYDALGRLQQKFWPDRNSEFYTYDYDGNIIGTVTRRSAELSMFYDALNRLIKRVQPGESYPVPTQLVNNGKVIFQSPLYPNCGLGYCLSGETATFQYDVMGNMTEADNPDAMVSRTYYPYGPINTDTLRIRSYTGLGDFSQHVYGLQSIFDLDGRRTQLLHPTNIAARSGGTTFATEQYSYDALGRLSTIHDVMGDDFTYSYDLDSRISHIASTAFGLSERRMYDLDGRLSTRIDSTADVSTTTGTGSAVLHNDALYYDARGNVIETDAVPEISHNDYSALGTMVHGIIVPNTIEKYPWDLDEEVYIPDAFGNQSWRWSATCGSNTCDSIADAMQSFYHAKTARLDSARYNVSNTVQPLQQRSQQMGYDQAGNRVNFFESRSVDASEHFTFITNSFYYDATDHLKVSDKQSCYFDNGLNACAAEEQALPFTQETRWEDYYYDALGRRVLLRSRDDLLTPCEVNATSTHPGCFGTIERTVYDGSQVLYEIRMPGDDSVPAPELERDTGGVATYVGHDFLTPFGRVVYQHGSNLDDPLSVIRIGQDTSWAGPVAVAPLVNWRGAYDLGVFTQPAAGAQFLCKSYSNGNNGESCATITWPANRFGYWRQDQESPGTNMAPDPWMGTLVAGRRDVSNLLYLRNRYFDPQTQAFTQEDPAGLAGGINAYGFAHGDPVNYADPLGLQGCTPIYACPHPVRPGMFAGAVAAGLVGPVARPIAEHVYAGPTLRAGPLRTTVTEGVKEGPSQSICFDCVTPASVGFIIGVKMHEATKDPTTWSLGPISATPEGWEFSFSTPDGCPADICIEGNLTLPDSPGQTPPTPGAVQSDATSTPTPVPLSQQLPAQPERKLENQLPKP